MTQLAVPILAADASTMWRLGDRFPQGGSQFNWPSVAIVAGIAVAVVLAAWLVLRWLSLHERRITNSPRRLFKELCAVHRLSYRERSLLARLAQHHRLALPGVLFVEPALWNSDQLGSGWQARTVELDSLRKRIFAQR
jgi:hypothetical protein